MNYDTIPSADIVTKTSDALKANGFLPEIVATAADALARIKELIPGGVSVMNGSSRTLDEIGFVEYLKSGEHGWNNLHEKVLAETDPAKKAELRKQAVLSDFYLGSVHALSETGELVIASGSGSQLPPIVFTSPNLIFVVSTKKIAPTVDAAITRVKEYVYPLEDERMKEVGMGGSILSKMLIFNKEPAFTGRKVHVILVNELLGF